MIGRLSSLMLLLAMAGYPQAPPANADQRARDLSVETLNLPGTVAAGVKRSYALVVGISAYKNLPDAGLQYAERDAESIYSILISPEGGNFRAENVHKLVGARATLANLKQEVENWLPSVAKEEDRVFIYFAGHGFILGDKGYLAPYDFQLDRGAATGYPMEALGQTVGTRIKAKWKVLLTDSCHSGAITPETDFGLVNKKLVSLDRSIFSLTASRDRERSFESPDWGGGHGIFTYYVVQGMGGAADEDGDGIVNADELSEYVRRNVREATKGQQNPTSDRGSFDPKMLLAYNPSGVRPGAPPAPKFGTLVFETNMDGVELYIDDKAAGILKKGEAFRLPGLTPGTHLVKGVKQGYEPDGPREETVYPGQEATIKINILILRRRNKAAVEAFDKGMVLYAKGMEQNYQKAAEQFRAALQVDPKYSQAALYLGRTMNALYDSQKAEAAFRSAIDTDPDYLEARTSFAGALLDKGDVDEAIRQLNFVLQRQPAQAEALYLQAEAYRMKGVYDRSIESARQSIAIEPNHAEAHFWLAESLRMSGKYEPAKVEYDRYLALSDFDSKLAGKLNYYVLGYLVGRGHKTRAAQQDIWRDLRSLAYFGLCDSDRLLRREDSAIQYCRRALTYVSDDPYLHLALGELYAKKAKATNSIEYLAAAAKSFRTMLALNDQMADADRVKTMLKSFDTLLAQQ